MDSSLLSSGNAESRILRIMSFFQTFLMSVRISVICSFWILCAVSRRTEA
jgi:hypothetical protein